MNAHCWHQTGTATTNGMGHTISAGFSCCWCDERITVAWRQSVHRVAGHGPMMTETHDHYELPGTPCPKRSDKKRTRSGRAEPKE